MTLRPAPVSVGVEEHVSAEDVSFAEALATGEPSAVAAFDGRYRPVIRHALGTALRRWRPETPIEAEDEIQDFVGFLFSDGGRRLRTFSGKASLGSWMYTVALRYFQRRLSKLAKDRRVDEAVLARLPSPEDRDPEFAAAAAEDAAALRAAVQQLNEQDQLYVRLFFVDGLNASEVARTLGKGTSAVRMRKMRILERLRKTLQPLREAT